MNIYENYESTVKLPANAPNLDAETSVIDCFKKVENLSSPIVLTVSFLCFHLL